VLKSQNVRLQNERKRVDGDDTRQQHNRVTQSGLLAVYASFQFVDIRDNGS